LRNNPAVSWTETQREKVFKLQVALKKRKQQKPPTKRTTPKREGDKYQKTLIKQI
jgi:hypothetical protein